MKNIFKVSEAEKDRIRKLHENYSILDECGENYDEDLAPEGRLDQVEDEISFLMDVEEDDVIEMEEGDDYEDIDHEDRDEFGGRKSRVVGVDSDIDKQRMGEEDNEEELPENNRTLGGGDETKGGLPKQRGSKPSAMKR